MERPRITWCLGGLGVTSRRLLGGWLAATSLLIVLGWGPVAAQPKPERTQVEGDASEGTKDSTRLKVGDYFSVTPQIAPLRPLDHLPAGVDAKLHAVVATMPDPVETRLGRSFDMELAAVLSAYQARGYVLDGFAFSWWPRVQSSDAKTKDDKGKTPTEITGEARLRREYHRQAPSVLLFRKDGWRRGGQVEYYLLFLVGDAQSFGIDPDAGGTALRCAMLFNSANWRDIEAEARGKDCDGVVPKPPMQRLYVIGPSFSGSMQSLATAIANFCKDRPCEGVDRRIVLVSPSASVRSNDAIIGHPFLPAQQGKKSAYIEYFALSESLRDQLAKLINFLCINNHLPHKRIAIMAEESTFGRDAMEFDGVGGCARDISIVTRQFPPNIASIRAEHSELRRALRAEMPAPPSVSGRLLELDMSGTEAATDRPPVYQPSLSSRSDELMLYRTFDSMRVWSRPDAVIIVATDVRDRLFLLGEVRNALPTALPVMVELDFLAVHPDYRKVSRGAVVMAGGDPLVCLNADEEVAPCYRWGDKVNYFSFATDYAANVFRAVLLIDEYDRKHAGRPFAFFMASKSLAEPDKVPLAYVATLAGFEGIGGVDAQRSLMAVADMRLAMQQPVYLILMLGSLLFVVIAIWLWVGREKGRVVLPFLRALMYDFRSLCKSALMPWHRGRHRPSGRAPSKHAQESLLPGHFRVWLVALAILGAVGASIAAFRGFQLTPFSDCTEMRRPCFFRLANGRDALALACIWLLYACFCVIAYMRMSVSNRRYAFYIRAFNRKGNHDIRHARSITGVSWAVPVVCVLLVMVPIYWSNASAVSLDNGTVWWGAVIVMATGIAFLINLLWQLRLLGNMSLQLTRTIPKVKQNRGVTGWPTHAVIHEVPQTPFNLFLRRYKRDLPALLHWPPRVWARVGRRIMLDGGRDQWRITSIDDRQFDDWTEQLVAELKLGVVTVRTCAWCAMLAPISVLLAMSVYPPVYERWLAPLAIFQLLASFMVTILVVLRLEKDPMLGLMFTRDGDTLTIGGGLRALWPKFVAMGLILIPLAAPDVWAWMHGLIRSINSFG